MKKDNIHMLVCPSCKGTLVLQVIKNENDNIIQGSLTCTNCHKQYDISNGYPKMYILEKRASDLQKNLRVSQFVITPESLKKLIISNRYRIKLNIIDSFISSRNLTIFLICCSWILLFLGLILLIFNYSVFLQGGVNKFFLPIAYILILIAILLFIIDYIRYRIKANKRYANNLLKLSELSNREKLSEHDIRTSVKERESDYQKLYDDHRAYVNSKGVKIESILNKYNFNVKKMLIAGCAGELCKASAQPYFDKGYEMIGLDVSQEFLEQFNKIFKADVILANGMTLPFNDNVFDLINYTDILEHLHNPIMGLQEAYRVLKPEGIVIIATPNRNFSVGFINPLVLIERIIGLYFDGVLPHRGILGHWMDFDFYHTEFSKKEVTELTRLAGFKILSLETMFFVTAKELKCVVAILNNLLKYIPIVKHLRPEFVLIASK